MGSLTALLNLTQSALQANQTAINVTSSNVANVNTPGYTQEIANWQSVDSVSLSGSASTGAGATVTVSSVRDLVLNQRINLQTQTQSSSSAESTALNDLQSVFGISSSSTSASSTALGSGIDNFFNSLSALQASPSAATSRQAVIAAAQTLASNLNDASNQIAQQTTALNQQVPGVVGQINSLTVSIAALNLEIQSTSPHADAGTLEDQRQQDLTQLSKLIGFDQTKTENNGLTLTTMGGSPLVSEGQSFALNTATVNGNQNVVTAAGQDITTGLTGGSLGGVIQARDVDLPHVSSALNTLAYSIGSAVNAQNQAGLDGYGNPGAAIFNLPASAAGYAATISVATTDPNAVAAAAVGQGSSGGTNAAALSGLQSQPAALLGNQTPAAYYASLLTQVGNSALSLSNASSVQQASLSQLTTQQGAQSGVSLDSEAANLTLYQRSYEAAAKVFSIVDQLLASALNLGQQTTVS
jgi:flagellar hook-associated protein 1 FlgK